MPQFRTPRSRPDHCSSSGFSFEKLVNLLQIIGGTPTLEDGSQKASRVMIIGSVLFNLLFNLLLTPNSFS
ncbi:hypothetical protein CSPX01_02589 [Colletotrichum filicis]|nr:hypothetical protein CSPX01_02589 [Colletotrichum filicis]